MTRLDQFESVFKSASKPVFHLEDVKWNKILLVTDLEGFELQALSSRVQDWLSVLTVHGDPEWHAAGVQESTTIGDLLDLVEIQRPDLIVTYRNLHSGTWRWPYSLGDHLDVLTQVVNTPVLVIPRPEVLSEHEELLSNTDSVMVMTDHLTGDHHLVSVAAAFTQKDGTLFLTHVEDDVVFQRYSETLGKISTIATETAQEAIAKQLLKDPHDYIQACRKVLEPSSQHLHIQEVVKFGHHLSEYRELVETHQVDLLVMNTKDDEQLAMHGLAYPLAVELRHLPMLLL